VSDEPFEFKDHYEYHGKLDPYTTVESYNIEYDPDLD
jgi:hypothetical protein